MTRDEAKNMLPVIQAFAEGKDVQFKRSDGYWINVPTSHGLIFSPSVEYRIKPEPFECWVVKNNIGALTAYFTEKGAAHIRNNGSLQPYTIHHMREVIE